MGSGKLADSRTNIARTGGARYRGLPNPCSFARHTENLPTHTIWLRASAAKLMSSVFVSFDLVSDQFRKALRVPGSFIEILLDLLRQESVRGYPFWACRLAPSAYRYRAHNPRIPAFALGILRNHSSPKGTGSSQLKIFFHYSIPKIFVKRRFVSATFRTFTYGTPARTTA